MADETARSIARDWWDKHIDTGDEVDLRNLSKLAATELAAKPAFCATFTAEFLQSTMYEMGQHMIAARRSVLQTREGLQEQIARDNTAEVESRWLRWMPYVPASKVYVPLVIMTKEQVASAAGYLGSQKEGIEVEEKFLLLIGKRLKPGEQVGDVLTDDDLDKIRSSIKLKVTPLRKAA